MTVYIDQRRWSTFEACYHSLVMLCETLNGVGLHPGEIFINNNYEWYVSLFSFTDRNKFLYNATACKKRGKSCVYAGTDGSDA